MTHLKLLILVLATISSNLAAQSWFPLGSGVNDKVRTIIKARIGGIYAGGDFTNAGGLSALHTARWNGTNWNRMDSNGFLSNNVYTLNESNFTLYAGGSFSFHIQKWNTLDQYWTPVGTGMNGDVRCLGYAGNNLYAGGLFNQAGGNWAHFIAKWDGSNWSGLGPSGQEGLNANAYAMAVIGNDLYVGGNFSIAGGVPANRIAKWNGSSFSPLGLGTDGEIYTILADGNTLYVGGNFVTAGGNPAAYVAKWDGSNWSQVGGGLSNYVYALAYDGTTLYAGGLSFIAKFDGNTWTALGGTSPNGPVRTLCLTGDGLYAGGDFTMIGGVPANRIARFGAPIGIQPVSNEIPKGFTLSQNYPNPFNPKTNINFSIAKPQHVKITVSDITGRQVAEIVNEKLSAGSYKADFDGSGLASGTYFYSMQTEGFRDVKKMIIVK